MTTVDHYLGIDEILERLEAVQSRRWAIRLVGGAVATGTVLVAGLLVAAVACGYWTDQPPLLLRWALLGCGVAAFVAAAVWFVLRALLWRSNPAQTARFIERAIPQLRNDLINSVLLAGDRRQASGELVQEAILEATADVRSVDLSRSVSLRSLKRWGIALGVALVMLTAFGSLQPGPLKRGLLAVLVPTGYVPADNEIELLALTPGDITCFAGRPLAIVAKIRNDTARRYKAEVRIEGLTARPMLASAANSTYTCVLGRVDQSFRYSVHVGEGRWPADRAYYTVTVLQRVEVEGLDVQYDYPPYTHLPRKKVTNADGHLEAPTGTRAGITLRLSASVPTVTLDIEGASRREMTRQIGGREFHTTVTIDADGAYRMVLRDATGRILQQLPDLGNGEGSHRAHSSVGAVLMNGYYRIHALPDSGPRIRFLAPNRDVSVPPGGELAMKIKAEDKYGLTEVGLVASVEGADSPLLDEQFDAGDRKEKLVDYTFTVPANLPPDGSVTIVYHALATDNRHLPAAGPQTTRTGQFKITVQDPDEVAAEKLRTYEQLRRRLLAILRMQEIERVNTEICWKKHALLEQVTGGAAEIAIAQRKIRAELIDLSEKFPFPPEMVSVQQAVALLGNNEARLAVEHA